MELALLASASDKANQPLAKALTGSGSAERILTAKSGAEARRLLLDQEVSLLVINAPASRRVRARARAHSGAYDLRRGAAARKRRDLRSGRRQSGAGRRPRAPQAAEPGAFYQSLRFLRAARSRMAGLQDENRKLQRKIEEIKTVDRAKCILIECCGMTEPEAHAFIEKSAMDKRITKLAAAKEVLDGGGPPPA